jgi:molybdate transport system ATP-binding protein
VSLVAHVVVERPALVVDVELAVGADEIVAVLGPNGAGKTTLLRALAGLVPVDAGHVTLDGVPLDDPARGVFVPAERRHVGLVFQDYCLFPHLSALDNVAFGLRHRGGGRADARRRASEWLVRVGLAARADTRPAALSGGEAQRVALARTLAAEPAVLLLDEPLSALDASTRPAVRRELARHLAAFSGPRLLVTHDPVEAAALADRLLIVEGGRIVQTGTPAEVVAAPRSRYTADLAGVNLLRGVGAGDRVALDTGGTLAVPDVGTGTVFVVIHPRAVTLHLARPAGSLRNVWQATVAAVDPEGERVRVRLTGTPPIVAEVTRAAVAELALAPGRPVWVGVKATEVATYPA